MEELEYIEDSSYNDSNRDVFFPSLEELYITKMTKLKGWWRRDCRRSCNGWQPSLSKLSVLNIRWSNELTSFPACSNLEKLTLYKINRELGIRILDMDGVLIKLKEVTLNNLDYLKSLPTDGLISICIYGNFLVKQSLYALRETFKGCISLRSLTINDWYDLRSLKGSGWEHLTALESLQLSYINNPAFLETKKEDDEMPWRAIGGRLRSLELSNLEIVTIPQEMRYLTSLQNLSITKCDNLKALPQWMSCQSSLRSLRIKHCHRLQLDPIILRGLTSLQLLEVRGCHSVTERFQDEFWEELRHIPSVDIRRDSKYL